MRCDEKYFMYMNMAIDGELGEEELAQLQAHLESCSECRSLYENLKIMAAETALLEEEPSPELTGKIMAAVRGTKTVTGKPARIVRRVVSIASVAAVFVTVLLGGRMVFRGAGAAAPAANESAMESADFGYVAEDSLTADMKFSDAADTAEDFEMFDNAMPMPEAPAEEAEMGMSRNDSASDIVADAGVSGPAADLMGRYGFAQDAYSYVLLFDTVPESLAAREWLPLGGARTCALTGDEAAQLLDSCLEFQQGSASAEKALAIVDPNA